MCVGGGGTSVCVCVGGGGLVGQVWYHQDLYHLIMIVAICDNM